MERLQRRVLRCLLKRLKPQRTAYTFVRGPVKLNLDTRFLELLVRVTSDKLFPNIPAALSKRRGCLHSTTNSAAALSEDHQNWGIPWGVGGFTLMAQSNYGDQNGLCPIARVRDFLDGVAGMDWDDFTSIPIPFLIWKTSNELQRQDA